MISPIKKYHDLLTDCKIHAGKTWGRMLTKQGKAAREAYHELTNAQNERKRISRPEENYDNAKKEYMEYVEKWGNDATMQGIINSCKQSMDKALDELENHSGYADKADRAIDAAKEHYISTWMLLKKETDKAKEKAVAFLASNNVQISHNDKPMDIMYAAKKAGFIVHNGMDYTFPVKLGDTPDKITPINCVNGSYQYSMPEILRKLKEYQYVTFEGLKEPITIAKKHIKGITDNLNDCEVSYGNDMGISGKPISYVLIKSGKFTAEFIKNKTLDNPKNATKVKGSQVIAEIGNYHPETVKPKLSKVGQKALQAILA